MAIGGIKHTIRGRTKMSATNSLHHQLCIEGAKYLLQPRAKERLQSQNKWSAVEIVSMGGEQPDVWATNASTTVICEVKTSISDFRNDRKKYWRTEQAEKTKRTLGNYRYYLVPESIADKVEKELPENWGLLVWDGKKITRKVYAAYRDANRDWDLFILCSILSREVGTHKVFNYRKQKMINYWTTILPSDTTIFVFGSNPEGRHGAGAAKIARLEHGAIYGHGEGLQGHAYAIPTKDLRVTDNNGYRSIKPDEIVESIKRMYACAKEHQEWTFKVCYTNTFNRSLNGYSGVEMIEMFLSAADGDFANIPENVQVSPQWYTYIQETYGKYEEVE